MVDIFADLRESTEPADPVNVDHDRRSQVRLAPSWFDVDRLPKPLVECGCGDCPDTADPLSDAVGAERANIQYAQEVCSEPRPMTLERAGRAYYAYQRASERSENRTAIHERLRQRHWEYLEAERRLMTEYDGNHSTALFSLRLSPLHSSDDRGAVENRDNYAVSVTDRHNDDTDSRQWIPPVQIDNELHEIIRPFLGKLRRLLAAEEWGYCWIVSTTESAATPHLHCYVYVNDPDDELSSQTLKPAVDFVVERDNRFQLKHHPVGADGVSDALVVHNDPPTADRVRDGTHLTVYENRGEELHELNTAGLYYVLNQHPAWVMKRLGNDNAELDAQDTQIALQGAAVAWASPNRWSGAGGDFGTHRSDVKEEM